MAHKQLRTFHLFAGAGGGILADLLLGHLPVGACEIEPYPRNVLLARQRDGHLPPFPIWGDVALTFGKVCYKLGTCQKRNISTASQEFALFAKKNLGRETREVMLSVAQTSVVALCKPKGLCANARFAGSSSSRVDPVIRRALGNAERSIDHLARQLIQWFRFGVNLPHFVVRAFKGAFAIKQIELINYSDTLQSS